MPRLRRRAKPRQVRLEPLEPALAAWYSTGVLGDADPHDVLRLRRLFRAAPDAEARWAAAYGLPCLGRGRDLRVG